MGGHWSFPKGHVEFKETEVQTALREVKEETGLNIQLIDDFRREVSYSPRPGVDKDVVYFLGYAEDSRTRRQVEEISEIRWIDIDRCYRFLSYSNDRILLESARQFLNRKGMYPKRKKYTKVYDK